MPVAIPGMFGQVIHQLRLNGDPEPMVVTYGVQLSEQFANAPLQSVDGLHDIFHTAFKDNVSSQYTLYQTEIRWNDAVNLDLRVTLHVEPKQMTGTGPAVPQNTAALVKKLSALAGRRNRGRFYMPGISEADIDSVGTITPSLVAGINGLLATWLANIETVAAGAFFGMFILHSSGLTATGPPTKVNQLLLDPRVATQRTRLRR